MVTLPTERTGFAISRLWLLSGLGVATLLVACSEPRETDVETATWEADIQTLVQDACVECHGGADPASGYSLEHYVAALGSGSDEVPNAIAGDPDSRILTVLDEESHAGVASDDEADLLRRWVVDDGLAYFVSAAHGPEIMNPRADGFHGALIADPDGDRRQEWDLAQCADCHGEDFGGTSAAPSCTTCHANGPTACDTCHGEGDLGVPPPGLDPDVPAGAHHAHLSPDGPFVAVACETCHVVPTSWDDEGHLDGDGIPEVIFSGLATAEGATPQYDRFTGTCSSTYCHGLDGARTPSPVWFQEGLGGGCAACHGMPPAQLLAGGGHPSLNECSVCHSAVVNDNNQIIDPTLHVDGNIGGP